MNMLAIVAAASLSLAVPAIAQDAPPPAGAQTEAAPFESAEAVREWMRSYYKQPDQDRFVQALRFFASSDMAQDEYWRMPDAAFFGAVFASDPEFMVETAQALHRELTVHQSVALLNVLWLTDTIESRKLLRDLASESDIEAYAQHARRLSRLSSPVRSGTEIESVQQADMLWAQFFATGDESRLRPALRLLHPSQALGSPEEFLSTATMTTVRRFAPDHPRVVSLLRSMRESPAYEQQHGKIDQLLREIDADSPAPAEGPAQPS